MTVVIQTQDAGTTANEPLLSYTVATTPSPLKASPENPQAPEEIGEVVISVARQSGTPADVEWIKVKVPAGTMAPDLATDLNKISPRISLTGWTVRLDAAAKEFVCAPTGSHAPIGPDTGFTIQLSDIPMSRKVGTAPVTVTERSREGNAAFQDRETIFNLGKFPADFYLRNFLCEPSIIANGGDVKLTWERSANATYELLYPGVDRDVTNRTSLDIEGVKSDTTFYLRATTGDPTNPVVRILSTQVTVLKPDLEVGNLTVHGSLNALGSATQIYRYGYEGPSHQFFDKTEVGWTAHSSAGFAIAHIRGITGSEFRFLLKSETVEMAGDMQRPGGGYSGHSATLPVKHGEKFSFRMLMQGTPSPYTTEVYWVPLGLATTPPTQDYIKHE